VRARDPASRQSAGAAADADGIQLVLSATNSSRSALATCTFQAGYFRRYAVAPRAPASGDTDGTAGPLLECRVLNKVVLLLFRRRAGASVHDVDEVRLGHLAAEHRLTLIFACKHGL
jgi:hypothetical protein